MTPAVDWADYLTRYHDACAGITEDLLASALDSEGRNPYDWLLEIVPSGAAVVDLACGNGPVLRRLGLHRTVGVDRSAGELAAARVTSPTARLLRADAGAVPLAPSTAGVVTASMALMLLHPLEAVLGEVARLLRLGGLFAATFPIRPSPADRIGKGSELARILSDLDQTATRYPEPLNAGSLAERFSAAGLSVLDDTVGRFVRPVPVGEAELVVRSCYSPNTDANRFESAVKALRCRAATGPVDVMYRIRRVLAVGLLAPPPLQDDES